LFVFATGGCLSHESGHDTKPTKYVWRYFYEEEDEYRKAVVGDKVPCGHAIRTAKGSYALIAFEDLQVQERLVLNGKEIAAPLRLVDEKRHYLFVHPYKRPDELDDRRCGGRIVSLAGEVGISVDRVPAKGVPHEQFEAERNKHWQASCPKDVLIGASLWIANQGLTLPPGLVGKKGWEVVFVCDNGLAAKAGLRKGDVVMRVDGTDALELPSFEVLAEKVKKNGKVSLTVDRLDEIKVIEIRR